jgi:hypothetical protein
MGPVVNLGLIKAKNRGSHQQKREVETISQEFRGPIKNLISEEDISGASTNNWVRKARSQKSHNFFFHNPLLLV